MSPDPIFGAQELPRLFEEEPGCLKALSDLRQSPDLITTHLHLAGGASIAAGFFHAAAAVVIATRRERLWPQLLKAMGAAAHALRAYQHGAAAPALAENTAAYVEGVMVAAGAQPAHFRAPADSPSPLIPAEAGTQALARLAALSEAAQAVVDRWDSPSWKHTEPTGAVIARLRAEISLAKAEGR